MVRGPTANQRRAFVAFICAGIYNSEMPDIHHDFPIRASADKVFAAIATPAGLDTWWTQRSSGHPEIGTEYELWFGEKFEWRAVVSKCVPNSEFELELTRADPDWLGSRVGFLLAEKTALPRFSFITPVGLRRTSTIASPATAGRCTCD
jgi:uncharacterized protein YndB with AHSA1/START domain